MRCRCWGCGRSHRLRTEPTLAGASLLSACSPDVLAVSSSLVFGAGRSPCAAPHDASLRRSSTRLPVGSTSLTDSDFHWLVSWFHQRTERWRPAAMAHAQSKDSRLAAFFLHISWAVGKMPTLLEGDTRQQAGLATQWRASALKEWWRPRRHGPCAEQIQPPGGLFLAHLMGCGQDAHSP